MSVCVVPGNKKVLAAPRPLYCSEISKSSEILYNLYNEVVDCSGIGAIIQTILLRLSGITVLL